MISGVCKAYNLTFDYVLHKISYVNLIMYCSTIESFDDEKDGSVQKNDGNAKKTTGLSFQSLLNNLKEYE